MASICMAGRTLKTWALSSLGVTILSSDILSRASINSDDIESPLVFRLNLGVSEPRVSLCLFLVGVSAETS